MAGGGGGLREALLQYQHQVTLYEKLGREVGGPRDDAELRAQLRAQEAVVKVSFRLRLGVGSWVGGNHPFADCHPRLLGSVDE